MTIDDSDVRVLLRRATDHLTDPPDLLDSVRQGGRRRVIRRRTLLTAGLAVAGAAAVGAAQSLRSRDRAQVASPLLDGPTRGDLARDEAYLRRVRVAWRQHVSDLDTALSGEPHVVWAGWTPAGPAAYVAQRTAFHPVVSQPGGGRLVALAGFVEPTADGPRVMALEQVSDSSEDGNSTAALLGMGRDVLLVLDDGYPMELSTELRYADDGRIDRTFRPLAFRDGAAVVEVPPQRPKITIALARTGVSGPDRFRIHVANASQILDAAATGRPKPPRFDHTLPGAERVWGDNPGDLARRHVYDTDVLTPYFDTGGMHNPGTSPELTVYGATPDGRRLLLTGLQYDDDPARVIALLARGDTPFQVVACEFIDWSAALPVRLRLPDGQGTVVAAQHAAFSYRIGDGAWQDAGRRAALLPAMATEVRVAPDGGSPTVVPLT